MGQTGASPSAAGIAWDSVDYYDGDGALRDWDELETEAAIVTDTLRRLGE
jgi:hypothetical protein